MPISNAAFQEEVWTLTVETSQGPLEVRYRPNALTPAKEAQLGRLMKAADGGDGDADWSLALLYAELIESLDISGPVVDDDGNELVARDVIVPIEPEVLIHLSSRMLGAVMDAIMDDLREANEERSKPARPAARPSKKKSRRGSFAP